jgi:hypothetical protein
MIKLLAGLIAHFGERLLTRARATRIRLVAQSGVALPTIRQ